MERLAGFCVPDAIDRYHFKIVLVVGTKLCNGSIQDGSVLFLILRKNIYVSKTYLDVFNS